MRTSALPTTIQPRAKKVCDGFCDFFLDKSGKIATKIKDVIASETLPPPVPLVHPQSTNLPHFGHIADENEIRAIRNMLCKTSPMDNVPTTVLKSAADIFEHLIANLAKLSFAKGVFPSSLKVGQVTPLLKKPGASTENMSMYRPITNLNTVGKILERLAMEQMRRHMERSPNFDPL